MKPILNPETKIEYLNLNTWQLCPKCNGQFQLKDFTCDVCLGEKIISTITGLPPSKHNKLTQKEKK